MAKAEFEPGPVSHPFPTYPLSPKEISLDPVAATSIHTQTLLSPGWLYRAAQTFLFGPRCPAQPFFLVILFAEHPGLETWKGLQKPPSPSPLELEPPA